MCRYLRRESIFRWAETPAPALLCLGSALQQSLARIGLELPEKKRSRHRATPTTLVFFAYRPPFSRWRRRMETCGQDRTPSWVPSNGNALNCSRTSICRRMLCFAVAERVRYNRVPGLATAADQSGERDGRTIPWHAAIREAAGRPAGFVEGNRGLPQPRRDDGAALGEAGGNARSPAPA